MLLLEGHRQPRLLCLPLARSLCNNFAGVAETATVIVRQNGLNHGIVGQSAHLDPWWCQCRLEMERVSAACAPVQAPKPGLNDCLFLPGQCTTESSTHPQTQRYGDGASTPANALCPTTARCGAAPRNVNVAAVDHRSHSTCAGCVSAANTWARCSATHVSPHGMGCQRTFFTCVFFTCFLRFFRRWS